MQTRSTNTTDTEAPASPKAGPAQLAKTRILREVKQLLAERQNDLPTWIRAPKGGLEPHSSLSRSKLYALADEGKIRSVSMKEPGKLRGCRLFHLGSIFSHIEKCEGEAGAVETVATEGSAK